MDPELMQLWLNATKKKSPSTVLNMLDNPMLAFLAGQYSPSVDGGGVSGQLWQSYAGNPDYPVVNDIMNQIAQGRDKYALSSYIDSLTETDGFQSEDLKGLSNELVKEYTGSSRKGSSDVFAKAGLRSPMDLYTESDVPISPELMRLMAQQASKTGVAGEAYTKAKGKEQALANESAKFAKDKDVIKRGIPAWQQQLINKIYSPESGKIAGLNILGLDDKRKLPLINATQGELVGGVMNDIASFVPNIALGALSAVVPGARQFMWNPFKKGSRQTDFSEYEKAMSRRQKKYETEAAYDEAKLASESARRVALAAKNAEDSYRRGALRAYREAGITPAQEQMKSILRFLNNK